MGAEVFAQQLIDSDYHNVWSAGKPSANFPGGF
jgi:hypothetical protein